MAIRKLAFTSDVVSIGTGEYRGDSGFTFAYTNTLNLPVNILERITPAVAADPLKGTA